MLWLWTIAIGNRGAQDTFDPIVDRAAMNLGAGSHALGHLGDVFR
jgi:hypothetical protein